MPANRQISFRPPLDGVVKSLAFEDSPRGSLYAASDIWPRDAQHSRERLAVRPAFATWGSQAAVNLIHTLDVAADADGTPAATASGRQLMIGKSGDLSKHTSGTSFSNVGTDTVDESRNVQATSFLNKLYIANVTLDYKVYDFADDSVNTWTATSMKGTIPVDCPLICTWGKRVVLAAAADAPHVFTMSRVDDPNDWLTTDEDNGAAIAIPTVNRPISAIIPHTKDCLVIGTRNSYWILSGNPMEGGNLYAIEGAVGPINGTAWCKEPNGRVWMLTRHGLCFMEGPCGSFPVEVSRHVLPESLRNLDGIANKAYLEYDTLYQCIHIYVEGTSPQYFHYFPPRSADDPGSFWPVTTPGAGILAMTRVDHIETGDASGVIIGTTANLKRLDRSAYGGSSAATFTWLLKLTGSPADKAKLRDLVMTLGENTTDTTGTLDFYTAESMELVASLPVSRKASRTVDNFLDGRRTYINLAGHALAIVYTQGTTTNKFSLERIDATLGAIGKERVS